MQSLIRSMWKEAAAALLGACLMAAASIAWGQAEGLVCLRTEQSPALDGKVDAALAKAPPLRFSLDTSWTGQLYAEGVHTPPLK